MTYLRHAVWGMNLSFIIIIIIVMNAKDTTGNDGLDVDESNAVGRSEEYLRRLDVAVPELVDFLCVYLLRCRTNS